MAHAWIVVADAARARLFSVASPKAPLESIEQLVSPEARLHEHELNSDKPGRSFDSFGAGRHATEWASSSKEQEAIRFASEIVDHLEKGRINHSFNRLVIVADPHFLGLLRKAVNTELDKLITLTINKDLSMLSDDKIRNHLPDLI